MKVDVARQSTAADRRSGIIRTVEAQLGTGGSAARIDLQARLSREHVVIAGGDIDSIVSAAMLAAVSEWRVGAIVLRSRYVFVAPGLPDPESLIQDQATREIYGVDTFSLRYPSISNHPMFFGTTAASPRDPARRTRLDAFDADVLTAATALNSINLDIWYGTKARFVASHFQGLPYKYPLGTAQLLLAVLEVLGVAPRMYDRQYLPWLIANCDGGLNSIRTYPWNVENWWSALAAVAGPASLSESLYRLATEQRPTGMVDVDRRLRYDEPVRSAALNSRWNIASSTLEDIATVTALLSDLSGWPDPFRGGADNLVAWTLYEPTRGILPLRSKAATGSKAAVAGVMALPLADVDAHLDAARRALHVNFSTFKERGVALGWLLPLPDTTVEAVLGPAPDDMLDGADDEEVPEAAVADAPDDDQGQAGPVTT